MSNSCGGILFEKNSIFISSSYSFSQSRYYNMYIDANLVEYYTLTIPRSLLILKDDIIFFEEDCRNMMIQFCTVNKIEHQKFYDVWDDLYYLQGFDFTSADNFHIMKRLEKYGYTPETVFEMLNKYKSHLSESDSYGQMNLFQLLSSYFFLSEKTYREIILLSLKGREIRS